MSKIIWSKCEADGSFTPDEMGVTWVKTGTPSYTAVKWNNGITQDGSNNQDVTFTAGSAFSISFWAKMGDYINGDFYLLNLTNNRMGIEIYNKNAYTYMGGVYHQALHLSMPSWVNGENIHFGISCDWGRSAGDRIRLYVNGNLLTVGASYFETNWTGQTIGVKTDGNYASVDDIIIFNEYISDYSPYINNEGGVTAVANRHYIIN